jgi:hypothetical protein
MNFGVAGIIIWKHSWCVLSYNQKLKVGRLKSIVLIKKNKEEFS